MIDRIYTLESRCLNFKWKYINPISLALCWNIGNYKDLLKQFKLAVKICWLCTTTECVIKPKKYFRIVPIVFCCRCQHTIHKVLEQISIVVAFHWEFRLIDNWFKQSNKKFENQREQNYKETKNVNSGVCIFPAELLIYK